MRTFELRVYKLRTKEALDFYMNQMGVALLDCRIPQGLS
jgi:hypothetical protein